MCANALNDVVHVHVLERNSKEQICQRYTRGWDKVLFAYVGKWSRLGRNKLSDVTALPMCIAPGVRNPTVKRGDKLAFRNADVCNLERPVPHATCFDAVLYFEKRSQAHPGNQQ